MYNLGISLSNINTSIDSLKNTHALQQEQYYPQQQQVSKNIPIDEINNTYNKIIDYNNYYAN